MNLLINKIKALATFYFNNLKNHLKQIYFIKNILRAIRIYIYSPKFSRNLRYNKYKESQVVTNNKILIATSGGGYLGATNFESILALALENKKCEVNVLLCDGLLSACFQSTLDWEKNEKDFYNFGTSRLHCVSCFGGAKKSYDKLGIKILRFSDFISVDDINDIKKFVSTLESQKIFNDFIKANPSIYEHSLAGTLRFYSRGDLTDKYSDKILRKYIESALITEKISTNIQQKNMYSKIILHHGLYIPQGILAETFRNMNVDVICWHVSYRKNTFIFSHNDTYHKTLMDEPFETWSNFTFCDNKRKQISEYINSRALGSNDWIHFHKNHDFQIDSLIKNGLDLKKPISLMLTNVIWDAQLHYPNNAFDNMMHWVIHTINYFTNNQNLQLILRIHPAEKTGTVPSRQLVNDEIKKYFPKLTSNIFIIDSDNGTSTYSLFSIATCGLIYGTKTGVEMAANGIPVIVAGEAWVRGKGFTIDINSIIDYDYQLSKIDTLSKLTGDKLDLARKYAYHFFFRRMIHVDLFEQVNRIPGFKNNVTNIDQILNDKGMNVICDGIINKKDFIIG